MAVRLFLGREWTVGKQIGKGGFGRVFEAMSDAGEPAAVKLVPKIPGAARELLFVKLDGVRNVVPIIDSGETGDDWVLVMPRAEKSLREHLDAAKGPLTTENVVAVLSDVATALVDLDGKVVHRDLKPENILRLNGAWCLADFGISRYAEATTAPDTLKHALSPAYAAPERWRFERATIATDIYSLGAVAYELLAGNRPFGGPDYRDQHLRLDPKPLTGGPAALRSLIGECLYKAEGARPSPSNFLARLQRLGNEPILGGRARLQAAQLAEVARRSESDRQASEARSAAEKRTDLFKSASTSWKTIQSNLVDAIKGDAPAVAVREGKRSGLTLALGGGQIEFFPIVETAQSPWGEGFRPPAFNVVAHAGIIVRVSRNQHGYEGRSHSLWFCDAREAGRYQWFEIAFMLSPLLPHSTRIKPFLLDPGGEAAGALSRGMAEHQLAWPLQPLTLGDLDEFVDRWAGWFAEAANNTLNSPSTMPERPTPRDWRGQ